MTRREWHAHLVAAVRGGDRDLLRRGLDDDKALAAWLATVPAPRRRRPWLALALLALAVVGPSRSDDQPALLALVNGRPVTRAGYLAQLEQRHGYQFAETAVLSALILDAAEKAAVTPTAGECEVAYDRLLKEQFGYRDDALALWRKRYGGDDATLRDELKVQVAQFKLRTRGIALSEAALQAWYEQHKDEYAQPERVVFRRIVIPGTAGAANMDPVAANAVRTQALDVLKKIQDGLKFEDAARAYSDDPSAERTGGRVGPTPVSLLRGTASNLADALAALQPNQVAAEPILEGNRYILLQLVQRLPAVKGDFATCRRQVELDYLAAQMQSQEDFFSGLLKTAKLDIRDARYRGLVVTGRWTSPSGLSLPGWLRDTP